MIRLRYWLYHLPSPCSILIAWLACWLVQFSISTVVFIFFFKCSYKSCLEYLSDTFLFSRLSIKLSCFSLALKFPRLLFSPCLVSGSSSSVGALKNFNKKYLSEYVRALPYALEISSCCPYKFQSISIVSDGFSAFCHTYCISPLI